MGLLDRIALTKHGTEPPESVNLTDKQEIRFVWPGGQEAVVSSLFLRENCPCSSCIEEKLGQRLLDPSELPPDVRPLSIVPVGTYALRFDWSDGHDAGIYSWALLRELTLPPKVP